MRRETLWAGGRLTVDERRNHAVKSEPVAPETIAVQCGLGTGVSAGFDEGALPSRGQAYGIPVSNGGVR